MQHQRFSPQRLVAAGTLALVAPALAVSWALLILNRTQMQDPATMLLGLCLLAALIACHRFPIHIRVSSKVYMGSVVLFLMAALLPPALAATLAGIGILAGELTVQANTGNTPVLMLSQAGRQLLIVLLASTVVHLPILGGAGSPVLLIAAAGVMLATDVLTAPFLFCPMTHEPPLRVIMAIGREAGVVEAAQYLVGLLGAFESTRGPWTLALLLLPTALVYIAFKNTKEMHDETRRILEGMADAVDLRDPYTGGHSRRVTELVQKTLRALQKSGPEARLVISAARVHDIGKIGIPDEVLLKPGKLSEEEWALMKTHPEHGAELLARYPDFVRGVDIIRHHHEAWDGSGYPHRLKGTEIPFGARVIAVCDSYDAMTSDRPYRRGMSPDVAAGILREGRGQQWDAQIVDAFLRTIADQLGSRGALRVLRPEQEPVEAAG